MLLQFRRHAFGNKVCLGLAACQGIWLGEKVGHELVVVGDSLSVKGAYKQTTSSCCVSGPACRAEVAAKVGHTYLARKVTRRLALTEAQKVTGNDTTLAQ